MKLPNTLSQGAKNIIKPLAKMNQRGFEIHRLFGDWLDLMTSAFSGNEKDYLEVMSRYPNNRKEPDRESDLFSEALANLMLEKQKENKDYLGELFQEFVSHGHNGQFFTPEPVCDMMAKMTAGDDLKDGSRVCDPACGSGRTLMSLARINRYCHFTGIDLDRRCAQMTALNLLFMNVDGIVIVGNTLSLDVYGGWVLKRSVFGGEIRKTLPEENDALVQIIVGGLKAKETKPAPPPVETPQQLQLF